MMIPERPSLERRVLAALDGTASGGPRIPVVLGGCGSGRTSLLLRLRDLIGRTACQYIDVERIATTPERFLSGDARVIALPRFKRVRRPCAPTQRARTAFDATLALLDTARAPGDGPATFLLDEFLELRTFESFPGLRTVLRDLVGALAASGNRFVLTSRYSRARPAPAARRAAAVRDHPRRAAQRRRDSRDIARGARRRPRRHRAVRRRRRPRPRRAGPAGSGALRRTARLRTHDRRHRHGHGPARRGRSGQRAGRAPRPGRRAHSTSAGSATSCASTAPAATARSRRSSKCLPRRSR